MQQEVVGLAHRDRHLCATLFRAHISLEGGRDTPAAQSLEYLRSGRYNDFLLEGSPFAYLMNDVGPTDGEGPGLWEFLLFPFEIGEYGFSLAMLLRSDGPAIDAEPLVSAVRAFFSSGRSYHLSLGEIDQVTVSGELWTDLGRNVMANVVGDFAARMWLGGRKAKALEIAHDLYTALRDRVDNQSALYEPELLLLNNLGFMELASGHLVDALNAFEKASVRGGLSAQRPAEAVAVLLCNLAAVNAGLGKYPEAIDWCDQVAKFGTPLQPAGALVVFTPDKDWHKSPLVIPSPDPRAIAQGTRASALAMMDDDGAIEGCLALLEQAPNRWTVDLLRIIGEKLDRQDIVVRARGELQSLAAREDEAADDGDL